MEKQNINDLINKAKANNQSKTFQKVMPLDKKEKNEIQFSFYLSKTLLKQIKLRALNEDKSIKSVINSALETYLKTQ